MALPGRTPPGDWECNGRRLPYGPEQLPVVVMVNAKEERIDW